MFLNLRKRVLPILLLGFVGLTLYTYYRSTIDDYHTFAQFSNTSYSKLISKPQEYGKTSVKSISLTGNTTIEPSISTSNTSLNKGNTSTDLISFLTSLGPQPSLSASASVSVKLIDNTSNNNNTMKSKKKNSAVITIATPVINPNSVGAMYSRGHSVIVADKCPNNGTEMDLIIVIMSAPSHIEARMGIRHTWGHFSQRTDMSIVFILGTTNNTKLETSLKYEQKLYADVIRGNFVDSYSNLTLKTISTLEWVNKYCHYAKFLLKTDDDMFINIPRLLSFIINHKKDVNVIFGRVAKKWKPYRNKQSKYYVPRTQFDGSVFPDFTTGPAYLLSRDVIDKLYNAAMNQTYMKLEDVFTTGIIAAKLGVKRVHAGEFLNKKISYQPCTIQHGISIHMVKYGEQFDIWKKLLDGKTKCKR